MGDGDWDDFWGKTGKSQEIGQDSLSKSKIYQEMAATMILQYRDILVEKGAEGSLLENLVIGYQSFIFQYTIMKRIHNAP